MGFRRRTALTGSPLSSTLARWTQPGLVKSVQANTISIANGAATGTATITSIDPSQSIVFYAGASHAVAGTTNRAMSYVEITNATTITATRDSAVDSKTDITLVSFFVIEFWPGVIKSRQASTITLTAVTSNTGTINPVNTLKTIIVGSNNSNSGNADENQAKAVLTNATTITVTKGSAANNAVFGYQAIEFY